MSNCHRIFWNCRELPLRVGTSHIWRRTGAQFAARCGATLLEVTHGGRWSANSNSVALYVEAGCDEAMVFKLRQDKNVDPIFQLWTWESTYRNASSFSRPPGSELISTSYKGHQRSQKQKKMNEVRVAARIRK